MTEEIRKELEEEPIVTNDLVDIVDAHKLYWLGRWDNLINSGGIKVIPEKIENVVQQLFDSLKLNNRFFVAGLPDKKLGQKVCVLIEGPPFTKELLSKVEQELKRKLDRYTKPGELKFINHFKQTETGKVLRTETMNLILTSSH